MSLVIMRATLLLKTFLVNRFSRLVSLLTPLHIPPAKEFSSTPVSRRRDAPFLNYALMTLARIVLDSLRLLPSPSTRRVDPRETQVHGGLLARFIQGHQQSSGFGFVLGFEAGEGFGGVVKSVKNAFATEKQTITRFHVHASSMLPWGLFRRLGNSGTIVTE
jgi:hypothetical protein